MGKMDFPWTIILFASFVGKFMSSLQQRGTDGGKGEIEEEGWEDGERWGKRQRKHEPGVKWYGKVMSKNHQVYCVCAASRLPGARPAVSGQA